MEMVPGWIGIASISLVGTLVILLFFSRIKGPFRSIPFLTGLKLSIRYPDQTLTRSFPVILLTAVIIGSLSVGDGLLEMVESTTDRNLSSVDIVLESPSFISEPFIEGSELTDIEGVTGASSIILLDASASIPGTGTNGAVTLIGIRSETFDLLPIDYIQGGEGVPPRHMTAINTKASELLSIGTDESVRIDIDPFRGSSTNFLGSSQDSGIRLNLTVHGVIKNTGIGRYREDARDRVDPILIIDLDYLQERMGREDEVNKVLISASDGSDHSEVASIIELALDEAATLDTAGYFLEMVSSNGPGFIYNDDIFFHGSEILDEDDSGQTLSYFVDNISSGGSSVPYSVVTGLHDPGRDMHGILSPPRMEAELERGGIALNNWTADILNASTGETVSLEYRTIDDLGIVREGKADFTLTSIVTISENPVEEGFMPRIPGLTDSPTCGDWDPGFDVDIDSLDERDTWYWETYRTTPKGYLTIEDARELWSNPYGDTTAIFLPENDTSEYQDNIDSSDMGISIVKVRERALSSSSALLIFPAMFLTFGSMIMIGALMILHAVTSDLAGRRNREWGIMRAIGFSSSGLKNAALGESLPGIGLGVLLGIPAGVLLGLLLNIGLGNAWSATVEGTDVPFTISLSTFLVSTSFTIAVSMILVLISTWRATKGVLAANIKEQDPSISRTSGKKRMGFILAGSIGTAIGAVVLFLGSNVGVSSLPAYFTLGTIILSVSISIFIFGTISRVYHRSDTFLMVSANISRRPGKHPLALMILTMALTLSLTLTAVAGIMESSALDDVEKYGGGYETVIELPVPYKGDIQEEGLETAVLLSYGSEGGTCSNLNAVYPPRLLGLPDTITGSPEFRLQRRLGSFSSDLDVWMGLDRKMDGRIPIMVDSNTLQWIYYRSLGDEFEITAESGEEVVMVVIGVLEPSVLTGSFVMSYEHLREIFPSGAVPNYILASGGFDESEINNIFSSYSPIVTLVEDLARENIRSELSYLYLFRDFLVIGLLVSMTSSAVFTHVRALSLRKELDMLRRIGATRKRTVRYFMLENSMIFMIVLMGSIIGSLVSILLFSGQIASEISLSSTLIPVALVGGAFIGVSVATSVLSAFWSVRSRLL